MLEESKYICCTHKKDSVFWCHIWSFIFITLCIINKHNKKLDFVSKYVAMSGSVTFSYKSGSDLHYVKENENNVSHQIKNVNH